MERAFEASHLPDRAYYPFISLQGVRAENVIARNESAATFSQQVKITAVTESLLHLPLPLLLHHVLYVYLILPTPVDANIYLYIYIDIFFFLSALAE